jgi:hypothetical protein
MQSFANHIITTTNPLVLQQGEGAPPRKSKIKTPKLTVSLALPLAVFMPGVCCFAATAALRDTLSNEKPDMLS